LCSDACFQRMSFVLLSGAWVPRWHVWQTKLLTVQLLIDDNVQVDVKGLSHSTKYFYQFAVEGAYSPVGTFRLPPPAGTSVQLGGKPGLSGKGSL
jgi:hypothetical protein